MPEATDLKSALERLAAGTHSDANIQVLRQALQIGQIALATGERAVALGGNASDTIIITGDSNLVFKGADTEVLRQALTSLFPPRLHQLPTDLVDFTGREQEVGELLNLLCRGEEHIAISAIGGMGGVGKSALAIHVAHHLVEHYPDAQIVVDLRGTSEQPLTPTEAMANIIHSFHPEARLPNDPDQMAQFYRSVLASKHALVLLDNAINAAQVRPLLPPSLCALIVTSRRALVLPGMCAFNLDALPEQEARHLLQAIMGKNRATREELSTIADLCGRLPLALRVAGPFLAVHPDWTAGEYIQALADERERLAQLKQDDLDVEATLGLSAAQLAREQPNLAVLWQMLAVFPATFDRAAAATVWDVTAEEARDGLGALVERSLLLYDTESTRYRLHDLMRPVARNAFAYGSGESAVEADRQRLEQAAAHHAVYYAAVTQATNKLYLQGGEALKQGLDLFDMEWLNIQAGQAWAKVHAAEDDAAAESCSAYALGEGPELRRHPRERIHWLEAALVAARRLKKRGAEGAHLNNLGLTYAALGETRRAIGFFEQALVIAREISDRRSQGATLNNLGLACIVLGKIRRTIEFFEQALIIARKVGDRRGEGTTLGNLGTAYATLGQSYRAAQFHEQWLIIARDIGDRRGEGNALDNLGITYAVLGQPRHAIEFFEQALVIAREIGDHHSEGNALWNMSLALDNLGDHTQAITHAEAALKIYEQIEDPNAAKVRKQLAQWHEQK